MKGARGRGGGGEGSPAGGGHAPCSLELLQVGTMVPRTDHTWGTMWMRRFVVPLLLGGVHALFETQLPLTASIIPVRSGCGGRLGRGRVRAAGDVDGPVTCLGTGFLGRTSEVAIHEPRSHAVLR